MSYLDLLQTKLGLQPVHLFHPGTDLVPQSCAVRHVIAHGGQDAQVEPAAEPVTSEHLRPMNGCMQKLCRVVQAQQVPNRLNVKSVLLRKLAGAGHGLWSCWRACRFPKSFWGRVQGRCKDGPHVVGHFRQQFGPQDAGVVVVHEAGVCLVVQLRHALRHSKPGAGGQQVSAQDLRPGGLVDHPGPPFCSALHYTLHAHLQTPG